MSSSKRDRCGGLDRPDDEAWGGGRSASSTGSGEEGEKRRKREKEKKEGRKIRALGRHGPLDLINPTVDVVIRALLSYWTKILLFYDSFVPFLLGYRL